MVTADDLTAPGTRCPAGRKMIAGVYVEPVRLAGEVAGGVKPCHPEHVAVAQTLYQPATFAGGRDACFLIRSVRPAWPATQCSALPLAKLALTWPTRCPSCVSSMSISSPAAVAHPAGSDARAGCPCSMMRAPGGSVKCRRGRGIGRLLAASQVHASHHQRNHR